MMHTHTNMPNFTGDELIGDQTSEEEPTTVVLQLRSSSTLHHHFMALPNLPMQCPHRQSLITYPGSCGQAVDPQQLRIVGEWCRASSQSHILQQKGMQQPSKSETGLHNSQANFKGRKLNFSSIVIWHLKFCTITENCRGRSVVLQDQILGACTGESCYHIGLQ